MQKFKFSLVYKVNLIIISAVLITSLTLNFIFRNHYQKDEMEHSDFVFNFVGQVLRKDFKPRTCKNIYLVSVIYNIGYLLNDASIISAGAHAPALFKVLEQCLPYKIAQLETTTATLPLTAKSAREQPLQYFCRLFRIREL